MMYIGTKAIREQFAFQRKANRDADMLELVGSSFVADEDTIFGEPNRGYIDREIMWYDMMSANVMDIPGTTPAIWESVADPDGRINSNYGRLLYGRENGSQFSKVLQALKKDPNTRQAVAIYTRPTMHTDATAGGMNDFVCTNAVHYYIRNHQVYVVVQMRSNDAIFGYRNDYAWQLTVQRRLIEQLNIAKDNTDKKYELGLITWQVANLHIYPRHFHLVDRFIETGEYRGTV